MAYKKRLHGSAIIPSHLYVKRDADRQLADIILSSGRPGYVLVARQMGKTNLLLNAKRELELAERRFLYFDMSAPPRALPALYASIFSACSELHPDISGPLHELPNQLLQTQTADHVIAHALFEQGLRDLLSKFPGHLVVVLDEVDALVGTNYSDAFFSHVRKLYFSRANFPQLERLTFVLSGVAEPSDLIRDKNVSPFNIGEKIYLNDFSRSEFERFIDQTQLPFDNDIKQRLFSWTHGNPRLTWDITSRLEDMFIDGDTLSPASVDEAVQILYLDAFDRPPVDHIRSVVESDDVVRNAVVKLRYREMNSISELAANRLYLAGIISPPRKDREIEFKNLVVESALSPDWISEVLKRGREKLKLALELFDQERFEAAVQLFEQYIADGNELISPKDIISLSICYTNSSRFQEALALLERLLKLPEVAQHKAEIDRIAADCHYALGELTRAETLYRGIVQSSNGTNNIAAAMLGSLLLSQDHIKNGPEIELIFREIENKSELRASTERTHDLIERTMAMANLALLKVQQGDLPTAQEKLRLAISSADPRAVPRLLLLLIEASSDPQKGNLAEELAEAVLKVNAKLVRSRLPSLALTEHDFLQALAIVRRFAQRGTFHRLFQYVQESIYSGGKHEAELYIDIWNQVTTTQNAEDYSDLLLDITEMYEARRAKHEDALYAFKNLITASHGTSKFVGTYLNLFFARTPAYKLDVGDFYASLFLLRSKLIRDDESEAHRALQLADDLVAAGIDELAPARILPLMGQMEYFDAIDSGEACYSIADKLIGIIDADLSRETQFLPTTTYRQVRNYAEQLRSRHKKVVRISNPYKHIGRNAMVKVQYGNGPVVEKKFKLVQRDLIVGNCVLIGGEVASKSSTN